MRKQSLPIFFVLLFTVYELRASDTLKQWQVFEIKMTADKSFDNPYLLVPTDENKKDIVYATFKGTEGEAIGKQLP